MPPPPDGSDSQQQRDLGPRRPAPAATPPPPAGRTGNDWLVLIGIDRYPHGGFLTPLSCCRRDLEALRDLLHDKFGFLPDCTIELFDEDATERNIRRIMSNLQKRIEPEDRVLIAFSGHGWYDEQTKLGCWFAQDAEAEADGIPNSVLRDWCRSFLAKHVLVIADSCFSGSLLTRSAYASDADRKSREILGAGGLHPVADSGSPDGKHSVFNHYLRQSLERLAAKGSFVTSELFVDLFTPVKVNSRQEPVKGPINDTFHEGGQFRFVPTVVPAPAPHSMLTAPIRARSEARRAAAHAHEKLITLERDPFVTPAEKAEAWKRYLAIHGAADSEHVADARTRLAHWAREVDAVAVRQRERAEEARAGLKAGIEQRAQDEATGKKANRRASEEAAVPVRPAEGARIFEGLDPGKHTGKNGGEEAPAREKETGQTAPKGSAREALAAVRAVEDSPTTSALEKAAAYRRFLETHGNTDLADTALLRARMAFWEGQARIPAGSPRPSTSILKSVLLAIVRHVPVWMIVAAMVLFAVFGFGYSAYKQAQERASKERFAALLAEQQKAKEARVREQKLAAERKSAQEAAAREAEQRRVAEQIAREERLADERRAAENAAIQEVRKMAEQREAFAPVSRPGSKPGDRQEVALAGGVRIAFRWIPAGTFTMGSPMKEEGRSSDEGPVRVELTKGFWMGETEVTQAQWRAVMGSDLSHFKGDMLPVEQVSWNDSTEFCRRLSSSAGLTVTLPTEAQWEYACRANANLPTPFHFGSTITPDMVNYDGNHPYGNAEKGAYLERTTAVGSFPANEWGLRDMHGNVWEWCADWYSTSLTRGTDPTGPSSGTGRVIRGGSWVSYARFCRSAARNMDNPTHRYNYTGFRILLPTTP